VHKINSVYIPYTDGLTVTELEGSSYRKTVIVLQDSQSFSK